MTTLFQTDNLRVEQQEACAFLWLDVAGRSLNVFSRQVLADLDAALDRVKDNKTLKTLFILSAKPAGFIAGADINEFTQVRSPADAHTLTKRGQDLFNKLADLPQTTVAVVHGVCLGGGLEIALACDYRFLAAEHPKTQLGLPEVELGILPAWGGTQRLPRVVGLERALQVILAGKRVNARDALAWGLADRAVPLPENTPTFVSLLIKAAPAGKRPKKGLPLRGLRQKLLESTPVGRSLIVRGAERILKRKAPEDMPGPWEALKAVQVGLKQGLEAGLAFEREAAGRLTTSTASRNLVMLFLQHEQSQKVPAFAQAAAPLRRVGVVGAGAMGAGIAQLAALKGCQVVVQEVNDGALQAGLKRIEDLFAKAVERKVMTADEARQRQALVKGTIQFEGFENVDLVIEAALEEMEVKRKLFQELERRTRPEAILATNTSSLSVKGIQEALTRPERVAGVHFFNPVHKMPLVEVVHAPATLEQLLAPLVRWVVEMGKVPVVVKDSPGFVVNRILAPYMNEAVLLVAEGMRTEHIDQAMRRFGMPMGPLELLDQVGLDIAAHAAKSVQAGFGERFPPNPAFDAMCKLGWLGQKSGRGFYIHEGKKKSVHASAMIAVQSALGDSAHALLKTLPPPVQMQQARERLVCLMVNEAAACVGEELAEDGVAIDMAMVFGTGWAPHRGGPLHYADDRGVAEIVRVLEELSRHHGVRFEPCAELRRRAASRERFCPIPEADLVGAK